MQAKTKKIIGAGMLVAGVSLISVGGALFMASKDPEYASALMRASENLTHIYNLVVPLSDGPVVPLSYPLPLQADPCTAYGNYTISHGQAAEYINNAIANIETVRGYLPDADKILGSLHRISNISDMETMRTELAPTCHMVNSGSLYVSARQFIGEIEEAALIFSGFILSIDGYFTYNDGVSEEKQ